MLYNNAYVVLWHPNLGIFQIEFNSFPVNNTLYKKNYILNHTLLYDLRINTISKNSSIFYKRFLFRSVNHPNFHIREKSYSQTFSS